MWKEESEATKASSEAICKAKDLCLKPFYQAKKHEDELRRLFELLECDAGSPRCTVELSVLKLSMPRLHPKPPTRNCPPFAKLPPSPGCRSSSTGKAVPLGGAGSGGDASCGSGVADEAPSVLLLGVKRASGTAAATAAGPRTAHTGAGSLTVKGVEQALHLVVGKVAGDDGAIGAEGEGEGCSKGDGETRRWHGEKRLRRRVTPHHR